MLAGPFPLRLSRDLEAGSYTTESEVAAALLILAGAGRGTCLVPSAVRSGLRVIEGVAVEFRGPTARCGWLWPAAAMASWTRSTRPWRWRSSAARDRWISFCAAATSRRCATRPTCAAWPYRPSTATCRPSTGEERAAGPRSPRSAPWTASRGGLRVRFLLPLTPVSRRPDT